MTDAEALYLLATLTKHKSPQEFAEWAGCSIEDAISAFSALVAALVIGPPHT
jgi:hypothetical protein